MLRENKGTIMLMIPPLKYIRRNTKCRFYGKSGHFQKDCLKFKAWLEKKGQHSTFTCLESNLTEVPYNTWWIDFGCIVHISNTMQGFLITQT